MKEIKEIAAQGDVIFIKVKALPEGVKKEDTLVVAHSETGHNHVASGNASMFSTNNVLLGYLVGQGDIEVNHLRDWDTHESLKLLADSDEGETIWEIRRQRESTPDGWKRAVD